MEEKISREAKSSPARIMLSNKSETFDTTPIYLFREEKTWESETMRVSMVFACYATGKRGKGICVFFVIISIAPEKKLQDETEESRSRRCFLHGESNENELILYVNKDFGSSSILLNYEKRPVQS